MSEESQNESGQSPCGSVENLAAPEFLQHGRRNPKNGMDCFFSEATFRRVMGPEKPFHERFALQLARAKEEVANPKKKERKDLDLPSKKVTKKNEVDLPFPKKSPHIGSEPETLNKFNESNHDESQSNNDGSEDEDEASTNLVIADDEEHVANRSNESSDDLLIADDHVQTSSKTLQESNIPPCEESSNSIDSEMPDGNDLDQSTRQVDETQAKSEAKSTPSEITPIYVAGITAKSKMSAHEPLAANVEDQKTQAATKPSDNQQERDGQDVQPPPQTEEDLCLVMPPLNSDSDADDNSSSENTIENSLRPASSGLPLIPALMSDRPKVRKAEKIKESAKAVLKTPAVASLFYTADQVSANPRSESLPESQVHPSKTAVEEVSSKDEGEPEVDVDIPIFSIVNSSEDGGNESGRKRSTRNKGIWNAEQEDAQAAPSKKTASKDDSVKKAMKFRQSDLTREEMSRYLYLYAKYVRPYLHGGCPPMFTNTQTKEMADFEALQDRVLKEQREFQSYLQQNAVKNPLFYNFIKGTAKQYAFCKAENYRPQKKLLPRFSHSFTAKIPLRPGSEQVDLTFRQVLLEMGSPPKITLPDIKSGNAPVPIPHDMKKIEENFPRFQQNRAPGFIHHEAVFQDANAQALAAKFGADLVLSSSVVKCLLDNQAPGFPRAWNIPVFVKEQETEDGAQKVVYLCKPMFEKDLLMRDYNTVFHKYALRTLVSHAKNPPSQRRQTQGPAARKRAKKAADDPFDMFSTDLEALETFGKSDGNSAGLLASAKAKDKDSDGSGSSGGGGGAMSCRRSKRLTESPSEKGGAKQAKPADITKGEIAEKASEEIDLPKLTIVTGDESQEEPKRDITKGKTSESASDEVDLPKLTIVTDDESQEEPNREKLRKRPSPSKKSSTPVKDEGLSSPMKKVKGETGLTDNLKSDQTKSTTPKMETTALSQRSRTSSSKAVNPSSPSDSQAQKTKQPVKPKSSISDGTPGNSNSLLDLILGPEEAVGGRKEGAPLENPQDYTPSAEDLSSLVYSLWSLGDQRVLIRTRSHGSFKAKNVYLSAKLEYQPNHGLEQMTPGEMVRTWAACYIRPNTRLLRARINAYTSEILMYEELDTYQILKPSPAFRPEDGFAFIHDLLKHLSSQDCGAYILSHEPGADYCGLRVQKGAARLDDLENRSAVANTKQKPSTADVVPWIPIDPSMMLPFHVIYQRIPATFLPKDVVVPNPGTKKPTQDRNTAAQERASKKKKKKKKKFQKSNKGERDFF